MRLSTKTRYGVKAVFDIAYHHHPHQPAQAKDIARRESIPLRYLEQIFQDLKRAGLIESKRGPRGGYFLRRTPEEITLGDVVRSLQGPIEEMFAVDEAPPTTDVSASGCSEVTRELWRNLASQVTNWFDGVAIADLVERGQQLGLPRTEDGQPMYFI